MADPTLMVRFKRDGKWPRARAAYGMKGNPKQGWIVSGTDKNGNEISHELEAPYRYEIRIEGPSGTRYKPAGINGIDAENKRRGLAAKKAVKDAGEDLGLVVVDPADLVVNTLGSGAGGSPHTLGFSIPSLFSGQRGITPAF